MQLSELTTLDLALVDELRKQETHTDCADAARRLLHRGDLVDLADVGVAPGTPEALLCFGSRFYYVATHSSWRVAEIAFTVIASADQLTEIAKNHRPVEVWAAACWAVGTAGKSRFVQVVLAGCALGMAVLEVLGPDDRFADIFLDSPLPDALLKRVGDSNQRVLNAVDQFILEITRFCGPVLFADLSTPPTGVVTDPARAVDELVKLPQRALVSRLDLVREIVLAVGPPATDKEEYSVATCMPLMVAGLRANGQDSRHAAVDLATQLFSDLGQDFLPVLTSYRALIPQNLIELINQRFDEERPD